MPALSPETGYRERTISFTSKTVADDDGMDVPTTGAAVTALCRVIDETEKVRRDDDGRSIKQALKFITNDMTLSVSEGDEAKNGSTAYVVDQVNTYRFLQFIRVSR